MSMKLSAEHYRALRSGAKKYYARLPINVLAKAMRMNHDVLRARLNARGVKVRGATLGALVDSLTDQEREEHGARIRKLYSRPDAAPTPRPQSDHVRSPGDAQASASDSVPDVRLALTALTRAARAIGPVRLDEHDEVSQSIADAILALRGGKRRRGRP